MSKITLSIGLIVVGLIVSIAATEHGTSDNYSVAVLNQVIASNRFVLLLVYNRTGVVCSESGLAVTELEKHFGNRMYVIRSDTTRNRAIYNHLKKLQVPYINLYKDGKEVAHFGGCLTKAQIQAKIEAHI